MSSIKISYILFFGFYFYLLPAQTDKLFVNHLGVNKLQKEHWAYISNNAGTPSDSVNYFESQFHLQYFNDSLFLNTFNKSKTLCLSDSNLLTQANISHLKSNNSKRTLWTNSIKSEKLNNFNKEILTVHYAADSPRLYYAEMFPENLRKDFISYKKYSAKKPFVGALLSMTVPGLGKWYAGRPKSFLMNLFISATYAAQSFESVQKLGVKHPLSLINLGFLGAFYFSNIYGGYSDVKQARHERKKQFLIHAENYYNLYCNCSLYK